MKKIAAICLCAATLSGAALLLQGCGSSGRHNAEQQETQEDHFQKKEQNSTDDTEPENDPDIGLTDSATGDPSSASSSDTSSHNGSQSDPEVTRSSLARPSVNGALRVQGTQLVGKDGKPVQLRGISTHGLAWFPDYVNEPCFQQLHEEWQANVIRLAMYTAEYGGFCTGGDLNALKQLIQDGVTYAEKQDMYVVLDWHILSDSNPNMYLEDAKAFFQEMTGKYAESDHIFILYEICNEPNGDTTWNDIKAYAKEVIPIIRSQDEDAVILVGTPNWSQFVDQAAADPITDYDNLMYRVMKKSLLYPA